MRPTTTDTARHEQLIADLEAHARADPRVRAAWLEGSFARGTADSSSEVDLHVAVPAEDFESFCDGARAWLTEVREPFGYLTLNFGPRRMFAVTLDDWVRLDLFVEPASGVAGPPRPVVPRVLFDLDGLTSDFRLAPVPGSDAATRLREVIATLLFGFTFPARLSGREEWGSLHLNALMIVYQFLVPAMLAQRHPEHTYRPQLHNERFLDPDQRERVDALVVDLARAFATIQPNESAVRASYRGLTRTLFAEISAAASLLDVEWPAEAEAEAAVRRFYLEELRIDLDGA